MLLPKPSWLKFGGHELLLFLSGGKSKRPGARWASGRHWAGCTPGPQGTGSTCLQLGWLVPGLLFSSGKTGDEGSGDFFFLSDEGQEARVLGFSVDVSLSSIRKWWRRLWVGFEVLETFSKSRSPRPVVFLKREAVVKARGKRGDASQNAAPYQM